MNRAKLFLIIVLFSVPVGIIAYFSDRFTEQKNHAETVNGSAFVMPSDLEAWKTARPGYRINKSTPTESGALEIEYSYERKRPFAK